MKTDAETIVAVFARETTFEVAAKPEDKTVMSADIDQLRYTPRSFIPLPPTGIERSGMTYSALNE